MRSAGAAGHGGRRVGGVLQRGSADAMRVGAGDGRDAVGVVLLEPESAAGVLLHVRQEPHLRALHQQPQRQEGGRLLRPHRPALLILLSAPPAAIHPILLSPSASPRSRRPRPPGDWRGVDRHQDAGRSLLLVVTGYLQI